MPSQKNLPELTLEQYSKEELVTRLQQVMVETEQLEAEESEIRNMLIEKMDTKSEIIGDLALTKVTTTRFSTKLPEAKKLGATKMKEVVDTEILKIMYERGEKIPGVNVTTYLKVQPVE